MEVIINFIQNYWRYISVAVVAVLQIVVIFVKRQRVVALTDGQTQLIIDCIKDAELAFGSGHGVEKLNYVISQFRSHFPQSNAEDWIIKSTVEDILKTPTKKGGLGREKTK